MTFTHGSHVILNNRYVVCIAWAKQTKLLNEEEADDNFTSPLGLYTKVLVIVLGLNAKIIYIDFTAFL